MSENESTGLKARSKLAASRFHLKLIAGVLFLILFGELGVSFVLINADLPELDEIRNFSPPLVTEIYDRDGRVIDVIYSERRRPVNLSSLPAHVTQSVLAAEDAEFYSHDGLDYSGIARASLSNLMNRRVGQGASTITQQVVRSLLLDQRRSLYRKLREALLAERLERSLGKNEILEIYLNLIYFGSGAYGIEEAARTYFGVSAAELSLGQAALIAGLIQSPNRRSPYHDLAAAGNRRAWVLEQMAAQGFITPEQARAAKAEPIALKRGKETEPDVGDYYAQAVRLELVKILGEDALKQGGYRVYTTMDPELQRQAEAALKSGLESLDRRIRGWDLDLDYLDQKDWKSFLEKQDQELAKHGLQIGDEVFALITTADSRGLTLRVGKRIAQVDRKKTPWPRRKKSRSTTEDSLAGVVVKARVMTVNDEVLELSLVQEPELEGSLVAIDPATREVKALVGGYDFKKSQYNRATQSRRPPGSAMKPIVYSTAFSTREWNAASTLYDRSLKIHTDADQAWRPKNYSRRYYGLTTLRRALVHSRNVVTVKLALAIGIRPVIERAHELGLGENFPEGMSLALGSYGVSLYELTNAYAVFAAAGVYREPILIKKIVDRSGRVVYMAPDLPRRVLPAGEAFLMTHLLEQVVEDGTAQRAKALRRPSAGKTGTTSDYRDAWYVGYTPELVTGVWVGRDDFRPLAYGITGSIGALPIWIDFYQLALEDAPVTWFEPPEDVYFTRVDAYTGRRPNRQSRAVIKECFLAGTSPRKAAPLRIEDEEETEIMEGDSAGLSSLIAQQAEDADQAESAPEHYNEKQAKAFILSDPMPAKNEERPRPSSQNQGHEQLEPSPQPATAKTNENAGPASTRTSSPSTAPAPSAPEAKPNSESSSPQSSRQELLSRADKLKKNIKTGKGLKQPNTNRLRDRIKDPSGK